jgi:hypothetical protein
MQFLSSALSWIAMLAVVTHLALLLILALPSGALAHIAWHAVLLIGGAAILLALRPNDEDST